MTEHYHGTPITPNAVLCSLAGGHFCVSHARPDQVRLCHEIGQRVMLDNGAYSAWKRGHATDWTGYYDFCDEWLNFPTTWAVIPDVIDAGTQEQDALIREWPHGKRGAPVWHMDEPIERLLRLCDDWDIVCVGSTDEYATVLSDPWQRRIDEVFNAVSSGRLPWLHMLRGMQLAGRQWPFASLDSTDVARNHATRAKNTASRFQSARGMMDRWDAMQTPGKWEMRATQEVMAI